MLVLEVIIRYNVFIMFIMFFNIRRRVLNLFEAFVICVITYAVLKDEK